MKKAIDKLAQALDNVPGDVKAQLHILKRPGSASAGLEKQIEDYIETHAKADRFLPTIIEEFTYP